MCGLARSGKSTWVEKNKGDAVVICPDKIRSTIFGHQFHKNAEDWIWTLAKSFAHLLLEQGKSIIVDATMIIYEFRAPWISMAATYNTDIKIVWVKTTLEECLKRNKKSGAKKIPEEALTRMANYFENPSYGPEKKIQVLEIANNKKQEKVSGPINYYVRNNGL